jgi:UDP-N-acetylglucosamine acyltransferase
VITQDVLPFSKTSAVRDVHSYGLNKVGLQRRGFSEERIRDLQQAFRVLLASKLNTSQALEKIKSSEPRSADVQLLVQFIESAERGVLK